jgi:hypothetical protein
MVIDALKNFILIITYLINKKVFFFIEINSIEPYCIIMDLCIQIYSFLDSSHAILLFSFLRCSSTLNMVMINFHYYYILILKYYYYLNYYYHFQDYFRHFYQYQNYLNYLHCPHNYSHYLYKYLNYLYYLNYYYCSQPLPIPKPPWDYLHCPPNYSHYLYK